jgi:hypothetical protein
MSATGNKAASAPEPTVDEMPPGMTPQDYAYANPDKLGPNAGYVNFDPDPGVRRQQDDQIWQNLTHGGRGLSEFVWGGLTGNRGLAADGLRRYAEATGVVEPGTDTAAPGAFSATGTGPGAGGKVTIVGVAVGVAIGELGAAGVDAGETALDQRGSGEASRTGKSFTPKGKQDIDAKNAARNNGVNKCENCGVEVAPGRRNERGATPPSNQRERDHVIPKSKGGNGSPSNGQVLCRTCNSAKSDSL